MRVAAECLTNRFSGPATPAAEHTGPRGSVISAGRSLIEVDRSAPARRPQVTYILGAILQPKSFPAEGDLVKVLVGPTITGVVQGGHRRPVSTGDIVIIPAGVPHGFAEIADHVTYLSIRPDVEHLLPAGYVHPALKK